MSRHPLFRRKSVSNIIKEAEAGQTDGHANHLRRTLTVRDLTFFGIAAVIGTGVFTAIGSASANGGPARTESADWSAHRSTPKARPHRPVSWPRGNDQAPRPTPGAPFVQP